MRVLSKEEILRLHKMLINDTGGSHGLRDEGSLLSALNAPFSKTKGESIFDKKFFNTEKYLHFAYCLNELIVI
jgi:prophage maintenance system killer protein